MKHKGIIELNKSKPGTYQGTVIEISAHQRLVYLQTVAGEVVSLLPQPLFYFYHLLSFSLQIKFLLK